MPQSRLEKIYRFRGLERAETNPRVELGFFLVAVGAMLGARPLHVECFYLMAPRRSTVEELKMLDVRRVLVANPPPTGLHLFWMVFCFCFFNKKVIRILSVNALLLHALLGRRQRWRLRFKSSLLLLRGDPFIILVLLFCYFFLFF